MSDSDQNVETTEPTLPSEMDVLKDRAKLLGVTFHPNIGLDKLRDKVNAAAEGKVEKEPEEVAPAPAVLTKPVNETRSQRQARLRREAHKLVRVKVTCMNPNKSEWEGEVFTASNSVIGTVKKFVPFNAEDGWHVPQIILNQMKERMYQSFATVRGKNGEKIRKGKLVKEFSIEILKPLNRAQLDELAKKQAIANNID